MDIIEDIIDANALAKNPFLKNGLEIQLVHPLSEEEIRYVFRENVSGAGIEIDHYAFGKKYIGKKMNFGVGIENYKNGENHFQYYYVENENIFVRKYNRYWTQFGERRRILGRSTSLEGLVAERNIVPEVESN